MYMESRRMVLMNLFAEQQWRRRHREQIYGQGWARRGKGCGMYRDNNMETYTLLLLLLSRFSRVQLCVTP